MAVGAVNQNNILDVIKAKIKSLMDMINDAAIKSDVSDIDFEQLSKDIKNINTIANLLFSKGGTLSIITEGVNQIKLSDILKYPIMFQQLEYSIKKILDISKLISNSNNIDIDKFNEIMSIFKLMDGSYANFVTLLYNLSIYVKILNNISEFNLNKALISNIDDLISTTTKLIELIELFDRINYRPLLKSNLIYGLIPYLNFIKIIQKYEFDKNLISNLDDLILATIGLIDIINLFDKIQYNQIIKINLIYNLIPYILLLDYIQKYKFDKNLISNLDDLSLATIGLIEFIELFDKVNIRQLITMSLTGNILQKTLIKYEEILSYIQQLKINKTIISNIDDLISVTTSIVNLLMVGSLFAKKMKSITMINKLFDEQVLIKFIDGLNNLAQYLIKINIDKSEVEKKTADLAAIIISLKSILTGLLLLIPIMAAVILATPLIIIGLMGVGLLLGFIIKLTQYSVTDESKKNILILSSIVTLLVIISAELLGIAMVSVLLLMAWKPLLLFFALLTAVVLSIVLISKLAISPKNVINILLLGTVISAILLISVEILLLAGISNLIVPQSLNIFLFLLLLTGIAGYIALLGLGMIYILPFITFATLALIPLTIAIAAIVSIAYMLMLLERINFTETDKKNISNNVKTIIDTALFIMTCIFYDSSFDINNENKNDQLKHDNWFNRIIKGIAMGSGMVMQAIMAAAILFPTVLATFSILLIAGLLWVLGKMQFTQKDKLNINNNVQLVIGTALSVISSIFDPNSNDTTNNPEERGWFSTLITYVFSGLTNIIGMIMAIGFLALSIVSVAMIIFLAGELKIIEKINIDSKSISQKIHEVISSALSVIDAIFNTPDNTTPAESNKSWLKSAIDWISNKVGGIFNGIKNISGMLMSIGFLALSIVSIGMVYILAKQLTYISSLNFTAADVIKKINLIKDTSNKVIELVVGTKLSKEYTEKVKNIYENSSNLNKILSSFSKLSNTMSDMNHVSDKDVENNTKLVGNYIKFMDKVNTLKVENVRTMTNMFEKMYEFSKSINGNFDKLADALVEKIAPLLAELKELLAKVPEHVQSSAASISSTIINTSGNPATWTPQNIKNTSKSVTDSTEQERIKSEQIMKAKQAKADQDRISELLSDILDTLHGEGSHPQGVKTY